MVFGLGGSDESAERSEQLDASGDESCSLSMDWTSSGPSAGLLSKCCVEVGEVSRGSAEVGWLESLSYRLCCEVDKVGRYKRGIYRVLVCKNHRPPVARPLHQCPDLVSLGSEHSPPPCTPVVVPGY